VRPVRLTLSGLHSFRDEVEVDFERLGKFGLFGIFGSIGAGKSTLLDGITLALFGVVDRTTGRGRKGIINHHSDRVEVKFRFELRSDGEVETWEAHRSYRRSQDGTIHRQNSRIGRVVPHGSGERLEVLADKEREVTASVQELLGLSADDFMRAVVLPQGRFMRFLHLKGTERRRMLQRIFRLGAYGEGLRSQVKKRRDERLLERSRVEGELTGLGDASEAAVRRADTELRRTEAALTAQRALHSGLAERLATARAANEARVALEQACAAVGAHDLDADAVATLEAQVEAAARAAPIVAPAARWREARQAAAEAAERHVAARRSADAASHALAVAVHAHDEAERGARTKAPGLVAQLERLESVLLLIERDASAREELAAAREAAQAALSLAGSHRAEADAAASALATARRDRRRLASRYERATVPATERETTQRATRAAAEVALRREAVERARARCARLNEDMAAAVPAHDAAVEALGAARAALTAAGAGGLPGVDGGAERATALAHEQAAVRLWEQLRDRHQEATHEREVRAAAANAAAAAVEAAETAVAKSEDVVVGAREALDRAAAAAGAAGAHDRAAELAAGLSPGDPCPVCGSAEHPRPARASDVRQAERVAHKHGYERALERLQTEKESLAAARAHLDAASQAAERAEAHADATDRALSRQQDLLPAAVADAEVTDAAVAAWRLAAERWVAESEARRTAAQAQAHSIEVARRALDDARDADTRAELEVTRLTTAGTEADDEHAHCADRLGAAWARFEDVRGELTLLGLAAAERAIAARDREAETVYRELRECESRVAELRESREALARVARAAEREAAKASDRESKAVFAAQAASTELQDMDPPDDPAGVHAAVTQALHTLRTALDATVAAADSARLAHEGAMRALSADQERARVAAATEAAAAATLVDILGRSNDLEARVEAILARCMEPAAVESGRERVAVWNQTHARLAERVVDAEAVVSRYGPSTEDASTLADRELEAAATLAILTADAAQAARVAGDRQARHPRWTELTVLADGLDIELDRLETLGRLLRGDRFVEYLANDYLQELVLGASEHLKRLTSDRYTLALDDDGGFLIRDDDGGGAMRPVSSLSGGETFMTSLALALALSAQVQARSARPLEFFFLDEGFGTLDREALDRVMTAIESIRTDTRVIGVISHVPGVRERVPCYLEVLPPGRDGAGSRVRVVDG
jgi:exonuclease SbcC